MVTWTVKVDDQLDFLVNEQVRLLGYSSKAEFLREAVRRLILDIKVSSLSEFVPEKTTSKEEALRALQRMSSLNIPSKELETIVGSERERIEEALLKLTGG